MGSMPIVSTISGCSSDGRVPGLGPGGRGIVPHHSDLINDLKQRSGLLLMKMDLSTFTGSDYVGGHYP